ncbi:MAG: D-3-phosphoglycerate dehydrogenase / 2-oxoglutarate reductase [Thermotogaceae bacterium]|nr:D-3-phosphoglycerate dehydrogenase / 2-oxoglutarate reductase [Thermotogaceae bacterium]
MHKVLIVTRTFGKYSNEPIELLKNKGFEIFKGDNIDSLEGFDALIVGTNKVTRNMLENSSIKIIAKHGVGVDNIDLKAATQLGIPVTITLGANSSSVAELTIAYIFTLSRNLINVHKELFENRVWGSHIGIEIAGKILGIIGFGSIGREVAKRAVCLGMKVLIYDPYVHKEQIEKFDVKMVDLETVLKESDFVSLHVPLVDETRKMIGEKELNLMKPSAFLINTSRGGLVDELALANALKSKKIAGAALDVFENEPLKDSPLFECENVIMTPHIGAHTFEAIYKMNMMAAKSIIEFFEGQIPENVVNKEVIEILKKNGFKK